MPRPSRAGHRWLLGRRRPRPPGATLRFTLATPVREDVPMPIPIDTILLVSAVVLIVAIVAARIGSRVGLPSLLLFLGLGMVARRLGLRHPVRRSVPGQGPRFRGARGDLGRRRSDHQVVRHQVLHRARRRTRHRRGRGQRRADDALRLLRAGSRPADRHPARRGHLPDRRRRRLLGAAEGADPATAAGGARGGVRPQRCADRAAGDPGQQPPRPESRTEARSHWSASSWSNSSVVWPSVSGSAGSAYRSSAGSRCRHPGSTRWPRWSGRCSRTAPPPSCTPAALPRCTRAH